jgi:NTP pyrophosphatase (non-canonical NTP hydrolase)
LLKVFFLYILYVYSLYINQAIRHNTYTIMEQNQDFTLIREWASERGIYSNGDVKTQYIKLMEEAGELGRAILKEDNHEFKDAIGDMVVVLTNLAHLGNTTIEECISGAWQEIKNRKGKMLNGTFVKEINEVGVELEYYQCIAIPSEIGTNDVFTIGKSYIKAPKRECDNENIFSLYSDSSKLYAYYVSKNCFKDLPF